jgi:uncharacterized protein YecA (UPF0149 family)
MAKYIEEQEILWRMNNALDEQDTYLPIHFKEMVIEECNTSDVVERSKIDKAIEEIKEVSFKHYFEQGEYMGEITEQWEVVKLDHVLEILKRNIGEDKENE